MGVSNFKIMVYIEDEDGDAVTGSISPIAFRHKGGSTWYEGTHVANGRWEFNVPAGAYDGLEVGVQTAAGVYTVDTYLCGTISGDNKGLFLVPMEEHET